MDFLNCHRCGRFVGAWGDCDIHPVGDYGGGPMEVGYPACARCVRFGVRAFHTIWRERGVAVDPRYYYGVGIWMLQPDNELPWVWGA